MKGNTYDLVEYSLSFLPVVLKCKLSKVVVFDNLM